MTGGSLYRSLRKYRDLWQASKEYMNIYKNLSENVRTCRESLGVLWGSRGTYERVGGLLKGLGGSIGAFEKM